MSNQEASVHVENNVNPIWTWRDLVLMGTAIGAAALSGNEKIGSLAKTFLDLYAQAITGYYIISGVVRGSQRESERKQSILTGVASIKRAGEQVILLGGNGSAGLEETFKAYPNGTIPVFNSKKGAERLLDWFKSVTWKKSKLKPFWVSLGLEDEGTTVVDTPGLKTIQLSKENLIHTSKGDKLVVVSFGNSQEETQILYTRLVRRALETRLISTPSEVIMVRLASMYDDSGKIKRDVGSERTIRADLDRLKEDSWLFSGGILCVDTWSLVMNEMKSIFRAKNSDKEKKIGLFLDSTSQSIKNLAWAEIFGFEFLGHVENDDSLNKSKTFYKSGGDEDIVYIEDSDIITLARVKTSIEANGIHIYDARNIKGVYIFETSQAARMAEEAGASKVICAADLQKDLVEQVLRMVKKGQSINEIQEWLDQQLSAKMIIIGMNRAAELRLQGRYEKKKKTATGT